MKRILLSFGAALCAAVPAFSASVIGLDPATDAQGTVDVLASPQVVVQTEGNPAAVYADWWQSDNPNNKVRVFLQGSGNLWQGNMPVNHAGEAHYVLWAETADGVASNYVEQTYTIEEATGADVTDARGLTNQRFPNLSGWAYTSSSSGLSLDSDWYGVKVSRSDTVPQMVSLQGTTTTNTPTPTGTTAGGFVRTSSIVEDGVGSVWFKARMPNLNATDGLLIVERYIQIGSGRYAKYEWTELAEVAVPASTAGSEWHQFHLILQDVPATTNDVSRYRIRNKTMSINAADAQVTNVIDVCDIVLTPPIPLVEVYKDDADYGPAGFPSVQDPVEFHVAVSNVFESVSASNITPRLVWRQKSGLHWDAWNETIMTNLEGRAVQGDGTYACVLSTATKPVGLRAGAFEYFYEVSYAGYTPTFPQIKYNFEGLNYIVNNRFDYDDIGAAYKYLVHTNALAFYTDAAGNLNEGRAPAVWPSMKEQFDFFGGVRGEFLEAAYDYNVVTGMPAAASWWGYTHRFDVRNLDEGWPVAEANYTLMGVDGKRTYVQPSTFQVEGEYFYAKPLASDGIRRFRTANDKMALTVEDVDEDAPSGLESAYEMMNVGDYVWQAIVHVTNAVSAYMFPTSANHHVSGQTYYGAGPYAWLETEQLATAWNPPTSGKVRPVAWVPTLVRRVIRVIDPETGKRVPSTNPDGTTNYTERVEWVPDFQADTGFEEEALQIPDDARDSEFTKKTRIDIDYDGFLMFRFCTTNGEYQVRRAAWQDFNDWAADINYFSRSYGLYDMTVYESDMDDRSDTTFSSMETRHFAFAKDDQPALDEPSVRPNSGSRFADGLVARNSWFERDRTWTAVTEVEEVSGATSTSIGPNDAVRLSTLSMAPGSLETTYYTKPTGTDGGRGEISFKARASAQDTIVEYYNDGLSWTEGYCVYALVNVSSMSDHTNASVSVFANWSDDNNYLEARLVQRCRYEASSGAITADNLAQSVKKYLELEIREKVDGVERLLTTTDRVNTWSGVRPFRFPSPTSSSNDGPNYDLAHADGWVIALAVNGTAVEARLYRGKGQNSAKNGFLAATQADPLRPVGDHWTQDADRRVTATTTLTKTGTVAFNASDAAATFRPYVIPYTAYQALESGRIYPMTVSGASAFNAVFNSSDSAWKRATGLYWDYMDPWERVVQGGTGAAYPSTLSRPAPTVWYRIQTYRTGQESTTDVLAPVPTNTEDWENDWDDIGVSDEILSVSSFDWQTETLPMKLWDDTFVRILALPEGPGGARSTGTLVVDDVGGTAWRGKTIYDRDHGVQSINLEDSWIGTYAIIEPEGRDGHKWTLEISRANPNRRYLPSGTDTIPDAYAVLAQSLTTPLLRDGVGDILFTYWAEGGTVSFCVEMIDEDTGQLVPADVFQPVYRTATPVQQSLYVPATVAGMSGRLRVRTLPGESDAAAKLFLDNLRATDYPNTGSTSWEAYNALISTFTTADADLPDGGSPISTKTDAKFDLQSDTYRSAVLNNAVDAYTAQGQTWDADVPYVQTPAIETGVGEISFWYRLAPGETAPGRISLKVAKSQTAPADAWTELQWFDLNTNKVEVAGELVDENSNLQSEIAALGALTNVTTETWTYFSAEFYQQENNVLRIYASDGSLENGQTGHGRVMLDNVLITEPVRASIDVGTVKFTPAIPLSTEPTAVEVRLVNPRMGPYDINVELEWFVQPGTAVPLVTTNRYYHVSEVARSTNLTVYVEGLGTIPVTYDWTELRTNDIELVEATSVPPDLDENWGYGTWARRNASSTRGTISFTNSVDDFTFVSTDTIPTDRFAPDTVFQYCVKVSYKGRFSEPVYSETQGRMQNGFWFDNPPWYEPIDLNKAFGTTNQPVAHFYSFAVGTNVFLNELRTSNNGATQRSQQFIEFLGPLPPGNKPQIKGWTITHAARGNSGYPILGEDMYTNTIAGTAVFREASNATTNKGWGFYVLGNAAVPNVDEELFPEEDSTYMYYRGALVVRRSMGAYAQRVCWTSGSQRDVQDFIDMGYTYLGALSGSSSRKPTYAWVPDPAAEDENSHDMVWSSAYYADSAITPGGFNLGQEDALWDILNEEEEKIPPLVSQPVVTRFEFADAADVEGLALPATWEKVALLSFAVQTTNGVALAKGDYSWYLESTTALPFPAGGSGTEIGGESAPADKDVEAEAGTEVEVTFAISVDDMDVIDTRFYRIKAYPKGE